MPRWQRTTAAAPDLTACAHEKRLNRQYRFRRFYLAAADAIPPAAR
ncbi:hypothetical protein D554_2866 [Bordetella holmesii 30539]|uniref:Uncharacterized protein n=2 Tax=Bordetella holmesii TaxID=35814 RepID=A0A158M3R4_9BORD|nr:hypothetical protein D560_2939 [Bordetella holmesii ATCC 51541]AIT27571.1 hypothetical protein D558_2918 [Bordetella holmesii 44057]EWM41750.1 hypothetical protein D556_2914 [Bordetella holmesii 41130]EWM49148.1 hypothetical protein D557_2219 [Bordetella holmesii 70147]EXF87602.1 hypothetical protein D554_2866 [Bordetella holmesii 30539]EXX93603.1 hypothetical protein D559_0999 [Bordetella holmesii 1058]KAK80296.1 hypothetical protein L573_1683 [Bordetella holmesii H620]KAK81453.1 hypothe